MCLPFQTVIFFKQMINTHFILSFQTVLKRYSCKRIIFIELLTQACHGNTEPGKEHAYLILKSFPQPNISFLRYNYLEGTTY